MPASLYLRQARAAEVFGAVPYTPPATYYLGFLLSLPNSWPDYLPDVVEVSGTGYARVAVPNNADNWTEPDEQACVRNKQVLKWPQIEADDWGEVTGLGIWDAPTGGNLLYYDSVYLDSALLSGVVPFIRGGELVYEEY